MKITNEHYSKLETAIDEVLATHPDIEAKYIAAGLSPMRLNWDLLRASKVDGVQGITWICTHLYGYLNDDHINTALKAIVGNSGKSAKALAKAVE